MQTEKLANDGIWSRVYVPRRFIYSGMGFFCLLTNYILRANISVAVIKMAEEFGYSSTTKGTVLSAFYYGYLLNQVGSTLVAQKIGGKWSMAFWMTFSAVFTALTPLAARSSLGALVIVRILVGAGDAAGIPVTTFISSKWFPKEEQSTLQAFIMAGSTCGTIVSFLASPAIINAYEWEWVFYVSAIVEGVWVLFWVALVYDSPDQHKFISEDEKKYIKTHVGARKTPTKIPWRTIFSTPTIWALFVNHFANNWALYFVMGYLPSYFKSEKGPHMNLQDAGNYSVLCYVAAFLCNIGSGRLSDLALRKGVSLTTIRKAAQGLCAIVPAILLAILGYVTNRTASVIIAIFAVGLNGFSSSGIFNIAFDVAPAYAGVIMSLSNTIASIPGIVAVQVAGIILDATDQRWNGPFLTVTAVLLFAIIFWLWLARAEVLILAPSDSVAMMEGGGEAAPEPGKEKELHVVVHEDGGQDSLGLSGVHEISSSDGVAVVPPPMGEIGVDNLPKAVDHN